MNIKTTPIRHALLLTCLILFTLPLFAQFTIRGTITDGDSGETLIGATVRVQDTTIGAVSNMDGQYTLVASGPDVILVFSYLGYEDQIIPVDGRSEINIALNLSMRTLSEMVVIGYGVVRKDDLTGSVSVISSEDLNRIPSNTFTSALQGRAPGVMVTQSGEPGMEAQIRVRGVGSINQDPNPIYVIDGVITNSLAAVQPSDIESIQVLKDASAAAIYGADGANGVIIITTKRGEKGTPRLAYSSFVTMNRVPRRFDIMNADEYSHFYNTLLEEANIMAPLSYNDDFRQWYFGDGWQQGTDWQDEVTRTGIGHNHNIRISGGGEGSNFSISANYFQQEGILRASATDRISIRANSDFNLGKYVRVGESFSISRSNVQTPSWWQGNPWQVTLITSPLMRLYNENNKGGFDGPQITNFFPNPENPSDTLLVANTGFNDKPNPRGPIEIGDFQTWQTVLLASVYLEVKPWEWLTYKITPSVDGNFSRTKNWFPAFEMGVRSRQEATLNEVYHEALNLSLENQITFSNRFGNHGLTATAVNHVRKNNDYNLITNASGFPYENLNTIGMSFEDGRLTTGGQNPFASISYLGRLIYDYDSKYLLTASIRHDGNSRFGPLNRWGTFPSVSGAWKVNEDFLRNVEEISMLKLRVGWGKTGNSNIGYFQFQSQLDGFEQFAPVFGINHNLTPALNVVHSFGNPAIRWEAAEMTNFGFDLGLFGDKIQLSAEYYIKDQDDLLVMLPVSSAHGRNYQGEAGETTAGDPWINLGQVQNRGFEFNTLYRKMEGEFNYSISANLTTITNEVKYIPASILTGNNLTAINHTIGSFYGYVAERIITPDDFDEDGNYMHARPLSGVPKPGDLKFKDLNNDGIISDLDRTIIGKAVPDFTYSFYIELMYRGWDFSAFFHGMHNYQIYNHLRASIEGFSAQDMNHNKLRSFANNYYREDRPSDRYIRADLNNTNQNDRPSTWYLEDASFFRFRDIQLGYSLPATTLRTLGMERVRIYMSATNLFTLTPYTGRDPEAPTLSSPLTPGNDNGTYPVPRAFTFGIQVGV